MSTDLPRNWCDTTIGEVFTVTLGQSPPSSTYNSNGEGLPFFQGKAEFGDVYPVARKWCGSPKKIAQKGDVLLTVRAPVGPTNIAPTKCCIGRGLASIRPVDGIDTKFILYFFRSVERYLAKSGTGTTFNAITGDKLKGLPIPIPPLPEQYRIVAKIEELFTRLDAGVSALKQVQAQLKCYRQSVLKAAVEGRLTAEWREQHKYELEPAEKLLESIHDEHREKWDAEQLTKYESQRKTPPKHWQNRYKEPVSPNTSNLSELPKGWKWASIDQISHEIRYGSSSKTNMDSNGIPVLRMGNIVEGNLVFDKLKYLPENHSEFPDLLLDSGDLLFNRTNSVELVGKTAVYNGYPSPCSYASYLIRVRFCLGVKPPFISFFINSVYGRAWIRSVVSQQVGQANVNGTKLKKLAIPLPPFDEQMKIVSELERLFSIIFESESIIQKEINRGQSLRQSILKRAFEGKLVPQDPDDEPASVLLERIKAEKAKPKKSKQMEMF